MFDEIGLLCFQTALSIGRIAIIKRRLYRIQISGRLKRSARITTSLMRTTCRCLRFWKPFSLNTVMPPSFWCCWHAVSVCLFLKT
ncbi:hypothetical protein EGK75_04840 [Neisseria weixii]|uniref:Uncharacterized protein n=1 Tax=Neisseria weixii TaxID=1853276 RepID=A0A3N4NAF7_9NEIS|nr:hypothetical protein EGK74_05225 [Neisseria weixii]RPD89307.1 hypothetical protein EGK75_04840 [Neisseria weixii]